MRPVSASQGRRQSRPERRPLTERGAFPRTIGASMGRRQHLPFETFSAPKVESQALVPLDVLKHNVADDGVEALCALAEAIGDLAAVVGRLVAAELELRADVGDL
jgi:hypothetical protein